MPRYANGMNARDPMGAAISDIASVLLSQPDQATQEMKMGQARYQNALAEKAYMDLDRARQIDKGRESISGIFEQGQMLQQQSDGMEGDLGLESFNRGVPTAVAKYGVRYGMDPDELGKYGYMATSQTGSEDMLRRQMPSLGMAPNQNTAITTGRADSIADMLTDRAIAQQEAASRGAMARDGAKPIEVYDESSPTGYVYMPTAEAAGRGAYAPAPGGGRGGGTPLDVGPNDINNFGEMIDYRARTESGEDLPLDPMLEQRIIDRATQIYQQTRNAGPAFNQAWEEVVGGRGLEPQGGDPGRWWMPFDSKPDTRLGVPTPDPAQQPPAQRVRGQVYDTPRGPMTWTGTGWVPAT